MEQEKNKKDISTIIITTIAIIIIIVLAFLYYYFTTKSSSFSQIQTASLSGSVAVKIPAVVPTNVITFKPSDILPSETKSGSCWVNSIAEPYRTDAWRCMVGNAIYDPCFETSQNGVVFCQINPLVPESFLIKLTKPLPPASVSLDINENWAWFVKLKDGTYCSPFTGTRPFFGENQIAYYGCNSNDKTEQIVLMGDLTAGKVCTANEAILTEIGTNWTVKSSQQVQIDTVWQ